MSDSPLRKVLISALHKVLAPLVRVMLAHEITLPTAIELLKRVFVEVAERDFRLDDKASTDSRISLITGVHRKDVKRLRELPKEDANLPPQVSRSAQIVATWITNAQWLDEKGLPRPLPRLASHGSEISFENLVASISQDIRPRSVLDEWLRLGVVQVNAADEVILVTNAFIPKEGLEEKLSYYGHNLGDHAAAAADNVLGIAAPWFERSVHHSALSATQLEQLRAHAADLGMQLLTKLHTLAEQSPPDLSEPDSKQGNVPGPAKRFTCGVYFYSADSDESSTEP
ncbi:MAG: hypothetical protein H6R15_1662 [Proteobacteria bacterium]|nr:hypothetical protein [Pseudomonadota bacterium]